jgi:hypothetical protein
MDHSQVVQDFVRIPLDDRLLGLAHHCLDRFRGHRPGDELVQQFLRNISYGRLRCCRILRLAWHICSLYGSHDMPHTQNSGQASPDRIRQESISILVLDLSQQLIDQFIPKSFGAFGFLVFFVVLIATVMTFPFDIIS